MNHPRPSLRQIACIPGITGLLLLTTLSTTAHAAEKDELALAQRQLDQVQASLERARVAAAQSDPAVQGRFFFDYRQATSDLNTIRGGIDRYLEPSRSQPRASSVGGNYRRERP
ncbi:RAQPRD family integrative conjugative element protein [Raoultella ornithinolytica]|uniref:integrative conjugative element protein, RAQPRD family n=1 Tax=Raoultella ornithinolytica TaxID=54291 RepID=UPI000E589CA6|nr:RAQPRD family integrative conjugative element protein [Raoultella ornithinolytica]HCI9483973.1 RAQPRD family integrative conjugative element protein [Raoultella ornithinolytica]